VRLDGQATQLWFAEELLEFLDHAAGTTVEIAGSKMIRDEYGEWREVKGKLITVAIPLHTLIALR